MIMASAGYYFYNNSINESSYPSYHVDMHLNTTIPVPYYPIHVNSNLTGNGTYQQLLTLSDPSHYGINANGSNLAFYDGSNNTHLYAWIQSVNNTSMQIWVKNYNTSNIIDMQVLPSYKDLFNATGYLGEAPQLSSVYGEYFNAPEVFNNSTSPNAWDFAGTSLPSGFTTSGTNYTFSDGLNNYPNNGITYTPTDGFGDYANAILGQNMTIVPGQYGNAQSSYYDFYNGTTTNGEGAWPTTHGNTLFLISRGTTNNGTSATLFYNNTFSEYIHVGKNVKLYIPAHNYYAEQSIGLTNQINFQISNQLQTQTDQHVYYLIFTSIYILDVPTFTIGTFTNMTDHADASYLSNSITIPMPNWFNLTLKAYTNYSFTFHYNNTPLYFTYDGLINNTIYTGFLDSNLTLDIHFIALGYSGKTELIVGR
jgi:hypothetical protein